VLEAEDDVEEEEEEEVVEGDFNEEGETAAAAVMAVTSSPMSCMEGRMTEKRRAQQDTVEQTSEKGRSSMSGWGVGINRDGDGGKRMESGE